MAKEERKMSRSEFEDLQKELHYLETVRADEVTEQIKEARSFGDLSENSEYDEAKNEEAKLYAKIAEIKYDLAHAVLIEDDLEAEAEGRVGLKCTVTVLDLSTDEEEVYYVTGSKEANPLEGKISDDSPFGRAIVGKVAGDIATIESINGKYEIKILSVERKNRD